MYKIVMSFLVVMATMGQVSSAPKISFSLTPGETNGSKKFNILISNRHPVLPVLSVSARSQYMSRSAKVNGIVSSLRRLASESQRTALDIIEKEAESSHSLSFKSLWITNQIIVRGAGLHLIHQLSLLDDVTKIEEEFFVPLEKPVLSRNFTVAKVTERGEEEIQWGINQIEAPRVWDSGNQGEGIVVATIDTGVMATHEALKDNFVGAYGWYDPGQKSSTPNDHNGHGTHTTGTIVGTRRNIGVAPGAKWAACKGCATGSCSQLDLLECGQWVACPTKTDGTNPLCDKAPRIVSNSWSTGPGMEWYKGVVEVYNALGIVPFFSIGNVGNCGAARSPGDYDNAIGVGATDFKNSVVYFSSRGPTALGNRIKPDVVAPGDFVLSADIKSDDSYSEKSGTSMACPHAAGVAALLLAANPDMDVKAVREALQAGSVPTKATGRDCGGISEEVYPNHAAGHGRINAFLAVESIRG